MLNFLFETFLLGMKNLRLHKLRSLLTALGIIIGVAAVIVMVAIGEGAKKTAYEQLQLLGPRNILLSSIPPPDSSPLSGPPPPPDSSQASAKTSRSLDYGLKRTDLDRLSLLPNVEH